MWLSPWCVCVTGICPRKKKKREEEKKKREKKTKQKNAPVSRQSQMQRSDWSRRQSRVQNRTPTPETDPIRGASHARLFGSDSRGSRLSSPGTCIQQLPVSSTRLRYYHHTHTHTTTTTTSTTKDGTCSLDRGPAHQLVLVVVASVASTPGRVCSVDRK